MSSVTELDRVLTLINDRSSADAERWWTSIDDIRTTQRQRTRATETLVGLSRENAMVKRVLDIGLAASGLLLLSPLLLCIALLIRIETPGPVLFKQSRCGKDGRVFKILKFRSMTMRSHDCFTQATRFDSRVTRIGFFLRRTSLDELPQLLNVIQGSMSLVGPRPHPLKLDAQFRQMIPNLDSRYMVKPGITGWAQINGFRGGTQHLSDMMSRVEYDRHYIRFYSLRRDIRILVTTMFKGWVHKNAY